MTEDEQKDLDEWEENYWADHWTSTRSGGELEVITVVLLVIVVVAAVVGALYLPQ